MRTMKKYLLLRDNKESGPYLLEEIAEKGLRPLDLIWIEKESTAWEYATEINELKGFVSTDKTPGIQESKKIYVSLPQQPSKDQVQFVEEYSEFDEEEEKEFKPSDFKENYLPQPKKSLWNKQMFVSGGIMNLAAVFLGLVLSAFVIKKMVDGFSFQEQAAAAIPIVDEQIPQPYEDFKNALVTETVPVLKKEEKPVKKLKSPDVKKQLALKASNYKVGIFGGISGLQLTLYNASEHMIDNAIIEVEYLKRNGDVVQSQNIYFTSIKPGKNQMVSVPSSERGMKIRYRITKLTAKEYKPVPKNA